VFSIRDLLLQHGYLFLFCYVFAVEAGVPVPADPLLLIMGALIGSHLYGFWASLALAATAALIADAMWFELGRTRGRSVLGFICRFSLEPDTCVRKTESLFARRGASALIFAKFVPGMGVVAMSLSGMIRMRRSRFILFDTTGAFLWALTYLFAGFIFHRQVDAIIVGIGLLGRRAGLVTAVLIGGYLGFKYLQRWRFLREVRINRIAPEALDNMLANGTGVTIVDLRHPAEVEREGAKILGALLIRPGELSARSREIPKDQEVVLYCTCPNEATSAKVALQLRKAGIRRVRPLLGGFEAWRDGGYPVERIVTETDNSGAETLSRADTLPHD
jgi:membrane protein DedA with SNARE-associated domain/rhodanese-related sulfurtransferase